MITKFIGSSTDLESVDKIGIAYLDNGVLFESDISTYTPSNSLFKELILVTRSENKFTCNVTKNFKFNNIIYYKNAVPIGYSNLGYILDTESYSIETITIEFEFNTTTSTYEIELSTDYTQHIGSVSKQHKKLLTNNVYANLIDIEDVDRNPITGCTLSDLHNGSLIRYSGTYRFNGGKLLRTDLFIDQAYVSSDTLADVVTINDIDCAITYHKSDEIKSGSNYFRLIDNLYHHHRFIDLYSFHIRIDSIIEVGSNLIIFSGYKSEDKESESNPKLNFEINLPTDLSVDNGSTIMNDINVSELGSVFNYDTEKVGIWYVRNDVTKEIYFYRHNKKTNSTSSYITPLSLDFKDTLTDLGYDSIPVNEKYPSDTIIGLSNDSIIYIDANNSYKMRSSNSNTEYELGSDFTDIRLLGSKSILYYKGNNLYIGYINKLNDNYSLVERMIGVKVNNKLTIFGSDMISTTDGKMQSNLELITDFKSRTLINNGCLYKYDKGVNEEKLIIAI
jgi:hypothetical protein